MKIFVTATFNHHRFHVTTLDSPGDDSLGGLKLLIWHKTGMAPREQQLSFNRKILDDYMTKLKDYGIGDGATLCFVGICIHVVTVAGQTIQIEAAEDTTINNVQWRLERFHNFPWKQQRLSFNGELLHAGRKLSDYNIGDKAIINLVIVPGA